MGQGEASALWLASAPLLVYPQQGTPAAAPDVEHGRQVHRRMQEGQAMHEVAAAAQLRREALRGGLHPSPHDPQRMVARHSP